MTNHSGDAEHVTKVDIAPDNKSNALGILAFGGFVEIYSAEATARMQMPASGMPTESSPAVITRDEVGSRHLIVARVLLQSSELIDKCDISDGRKTQARLALLSCKDALIACEVVAKRVLLQDKAICDQFKTNGVVNPGNSLHLPQVQALRVDVSCYLICAARAIRAICEVAEVLLEISLMKKNFDRLGKALEAKYGSELALVKYVNNHADRVRYLLSLRNYDEHPGGDGNFTVVRNFHFDGKEINAPTWHLEGNRITPPARICDEMVELKQFVSAIAEGTVLLAVTAILRKPFKVAEIPADQVNADWPVKFRVTFGSP